MSQTVKFASVFALLAAFAAGCASQSNSGWADAAFTSNSETVRLSVIGEERVGLDATPKTVASPSVYMLGAGDALGQALFANYVAVVRANRHDDENQRIVSGETNAR